MSLYSIFFALLCSAAAVWGVPPAKRDINATFVQPASSPYTQSSNYVGVNNGSLSKTTPVSGKVFDRFIQIWLENTDYATAANTSQFTALAAQGILLDAYYAVTHVCLFLPSFLSL
jgi:hypothetical protein